MSIRNKRKCHVISRFVDRNCACMRGQYVTSFEVPLFPDLWIALDFHVAKNTKKKAKNLHICITKSHVYYNKKSHLFTIRNQVVKKNIHNLYNSGSSENTTSASTILVGYNKVNLL